MRSAVVFTLLTVRWAGSELHIFSLFLSRLLALCWRGSWWGGPCRSLRSLRASASSPFPLLLSFFSVFIPRPLCAPLFFFLSLSYCCFCGSAQRGATWLCVPVHSGGGCPFPSSSSSSSSAAVAAWVGKRERESQRAPSAGAHTCSALPFSIQVTTKRPQSRDSTARQ